MGGGGHALRDMFEMQHGYKSEGISNRFQSVGKKHWRRTKHKDRCGREPEESRGDKGHFIIRVTQEGFRWEQESGRKDNYEALSVSGDVEEA